MTKITTLRWDYRKHACIIEVAYTNFLKPSEEFPILLNWPIMNTHEHFRNSQSRTFLACHFYSRLSFFFQILSGNEILSIIIDPSSTYSSLRNTYWCPLNWLLSWKCPIDWQSELTQLMHFGESTSIIAKPRYQKDFEYSTLSRRVLQLSGTRNISKVERDFCFLAKDR